jgi:hypothetical protein
MTFSRFVAAGAAIVLAAATPPGFAAILIRITLRLRTAPIPAKRVASGR